MSRHPTDLLSAFLDEELSPNEVSELTTHLADCRECQRELDSLAAVRLQIRALPVLEPAPAVIEVAREVIPLAPRWRRTLVGAMAAAAVVVVVGVGVGSNGRAAVPLQLEQAFDQHVARASVDSGFNVIQVQAVVNR
ncbi:MAG: zf-HC2 domain-containing protein [Acidimicrobiia bacterium]